MIADISYAQEVLKQLEGVQVSDIPNGFYLVEFPTNEANVIRKINSEFAVVKGVLSSEKKLTKLTMSGNG